MCYGSLKFDKGKSLSEVEFLILTKKLYLWSVFDQCNYVSISKSYKKCVKIENENLFSYRSQYMYSNSDFKCNFLNPGISKVL